jgi:hypothetical protein
MSSRQVARRELFQSALTKMPYFETWTESHEILVWENPRQVETVTRGNFRRVPRRIRRSMARDLAKRQFQTLIRAKSERAQRVKGRP